MNWSNLGMQLLALALWAVIVAVVVTLVVLL